MFADEKRNVVVLSHCAEGYGGLLCALCDERWYRSAPHTCTRCRDDYTSDDYLVIAALLVCLLCITGVPSVRACAPASARGLCSGLASKHAHLMDNLQLFFLHVGASLAVVCVMHLCW